MLLYYLYPPKSPLDPDVIFGDGEPCLDMGRAAPMACYQLGSEKKVANIRFSGEGVVLKVCCTNGTALLLGADDGQVLRETPPPAEAAGRLRYDVDSTANGVAAGPVDEKTVLVWEVPGWAEA